jgi:transposase-like protein
VKYQPPPHKYGDIVPRINFRDRKEQYRQLWELGWEYADIARALGVTRRTLYYWRIELEVEARKRGPRKKGIQVS